MLTYCATDCEYNFANLRRFTITVENSDKAIISSPRRQDDTVVISIIVIGDGAVSPIKLKHGLALKSFQGHNSCLLFYLS